MWPVEGRLMSVLRRIPSKLNCSGNPEGNGFKILAPETSEAADLQMVSHRSYTVDGYG